MSIPARLSRHPGLALLFSAIVLTGCDGFDEERAAAEIRERVCKDWPYGCSDSTRVVVEGVQKTGSGRQVEFRLRDRADATPRLSAAFFERRGETWAFLLFEDPFDSVFGGLAGHFRNDTRRLSEALSELKSAQRWFNSIYGRYAGALSELDSVSYKPPAVPVEMTVAEGFEGWTATAATRQVRCELAIPGQELPRCRGLTAEHAGTDSGPLSRAFAPGD